MQSNFDEGIEPRLATGSKGKVRCIFGRPMPPFFWLFRARGNEFLIRRFECHCQNFIHSISMRKFDNSKNPAKIHSNGQEAF